MDWTTVELASLSLCLLLLLLHNVPRACRDCGPVHRIARRTPVLQVSVHLCLPRHVVVRERHIEARVCLLLRLMRGCEYLVRLESAIAKRFSVLQSRVVVLKRQAAIQDLLMGHGLVVLLIKLLKLILLEFSAHISANLLVYWVRTGDLRDVSRCIDLLLKIFKLNLLDVLSDLLCKQLL